MKPYPQAQDDNETSLHVRTARLADGAAIADIYNQAIASGESTMDTEVADASRFSDYLCEPDPRQRLLVGELDTRLVAWGIVKRYSDRPGYRYAAETSVYVATNEQHCGHGATLLAAVLDAAKTLDYRHLVAKVLAVNEASVRFHQRLGFELVGYQRGIGFINGRWHDVAIMQHTFHEPPIQELC